MYAQRVTGHGTTHAMAIERHEGNNSSSTDSEGKDLRATLHASNDVSPKGHHCLAIATKLGAICGDLLSGCWRGTDTRRSLVHL